MTTEPTKVVDREGDTWTRKADGGYRFGFCRESSLSALRESYGPLTLPDGSPETPETYREGERYRDREGDVWEVREDGRFRLAASATHRFAVGMSLNSSVVAETYGPLTRLYGAHTPDKRPADREDDQAQTPEPTPADPRREALRVARAWAREDAGDRGGYDSIGSLTMTYARFLLGESSHV